MTTIIIPQRLQHCLCHPVGQSILSVIHVPTVPYPPCQLYFFTMLFLHTLSPPIHRHPISLSRNIIIVWMHSVCVSIIKKEVLHHYTEPSSALTIMSLGVSRCWWYYPGLHNKLLKPLAQGASRFEKLLARKKSYWPEKITGLNFRNQRRGLHTKHD